jgi:hypothetical protein
MNTTGFVTLDPAESVAKIARLRDKLSQLPEEFPSPEVLERHFKSGDRTKNNGQCGQREFLRCSLELAQFEHATGASPERIRQILRDAVAAFAPMVPLLDYSWRTREFPVLKSHADKFRNGEVPSDFEQIMAESLQGSVSEVQLVHVRVRNQPAIEAMEEAATAALIAWDFEAAVRMAKAYHVQPRLRKGDGPNRWGLFREAILGNQDSGLAFLARTLEYDDDRPQKRHELAEGVLRRDASLVQKGLQTVGARFKRVWSLKTYSTPAKLRYYGSLERMLPDIRMHLMMHDWMFSSWAVAWMSLAWHQGMADAFNNPKPFARWVPWNLCCPTPVPG